MGAGWCRWVGCLHVLAPFSQPVDCDRAKFPGQRRLREGLQTMTLFIGSLMGAWLVGFALGYNTKLVRMAVNAA